MAVLNLDIDLPASAACNNSNKHQEEASTNDDCSVSSEISLDDLLVKERQQDDDDERTASTSSSSVSWNPDDSDYSLNVRLASSGGTQQQNQLDDSARVASLMNSDYSLNVALMKKKKPTSSSTPAETEPSRSPPNRTRSTESLERPPTPAATVSASPDRSKRSSSKFPSTNKVSFFPRVRIQRVVNRKDLSKDLMHNIWYSRSEFKKIRQECFDTLQMMSEFESGNTEDDEDETPSHDEDDSQSSSESCCCAGDIFDDSEYCMRGLEYKTKGEYKKRQRNKIEVRMVVFDEQEFQTDNQMNDPEYIADLAYESSRGCVRAAIEIAKQDEEDARAYLLSP